MSRVHDTRGVGDEDECRRTLRARVALASGGVRLSRIRPATAKFTLPPEQAMVFAEPDSPVYLQAAFDIASGHARKPAEGRSRVSLRQGCRLGDQAPCLFCTTGRFFRTGYHTNLVASWLPALDSVVSKLEHGAAVADVGCGHGFSTIFMAKAFPNPLSSATTFIRRQWSRRGSMPSSTERRT